MSERDEPRAADRISELFDRHFDDVYAYVAFRVSPDLEAAADISQEVFLSALRGLDGLREGGSAEGWLFQIARNKVVDHFRRAGRRRRRALDLARSDAALGAEGSPGDGLDEEAAMVGDALRELRPGHVELLEDKYVRGATVEQMAARRRTSVRAVESALARARKALRGAFRTIQSQRGS